MSMRITTGMTLNTYRFNLQKSTKNLSDSQNQVMTGRKFNSYAEDPASATHAWRIRRSMWKNNDYLNNTKDTYSRFSQAYSALDAVLEEHQLSGVYADIRARTDTTASGRQPLGQELSSLAETVIQTMNGAKYGDHFVFAGDDAMNAPFSWDKDMKTLYYRGVNVNAGAVQKPTADVPTWMVDPKADVEAANPGTWKDEDQEWLDYFNHVTDTVPTDENGQARTEPSWFTNNVNGATGKDAEWVEYYRHKTDEKPTAEEPAWTGKNAYGVTEPTDAEIAADPNGEAWAAYYKDQTDLAKLKAMNDEHTYVDLGMGLQEDEHDVLINGTAFDMSLPGIKMLGGYGFDENGEPENVVMILKKLGDIYSRCDPDSGDFETDEDEVSADRLLDKLKDKVGEVSSQHVEITTKAQFLQNNQTRLEDQADTFQEQRYNIEMLDPADAIMGLMWDYKCYSAALKIGNQLLSQSLIDYMN